MRPRARARARRPDSLKCFIPGYKRLTRAHARTHARTETQVDASLAGEGGEGEKSENEGDSQVLLSLICARRQCPRTHARAYTHIHTDIYP